MKSTFKSLFFVFSLVIACSLSSCGLSPEFQLKQAVSEYSKELPDDIGDGLTITSVRIDDNNLIYECVVDETMDDYDVSEWDDPEILSLMKVAMMEDVKSNDPDVQTLISLCKKANCNLIYRYIGSLTGSKVDITFYSHEL